MPYEGAQDGKHYWLTPPDLFGQLDTEFHFDFDPCPHPRPEGFDGLTIEWGHSNYVNPPFKGPTAWVRKAIAESQKGKDVVFVFPIDKWVHLLIPVNVFMVVEDGLPYMRIDNAGPFGKREARRLKRWIEEWFGG